MTETGAANGGMIPSGQGRFPAAARAGVLLACASALPATAQGSDPMRNATIGAEVFTRCIEVVLAETGATARQIVNSVPGAAGDDGISFQHRAAHCQLTIPVDRVDADAFFASWAQLQAERLSLPAGDCATVVADSPPARIEYCDLPAITLPSGAAMRFRVAQATFHGDFVDLMFTEAPS